MQFGLLYDDVFLDHECQYYHPERPERLGAVLKGLDNAGVLGGARRTAARPAEPEELHRVHDPMYVDAVLDALDRGSGNLDPDTFFSAGSKTAALRAAGGGVDLARAVQERAVDWGWAVVRPPGHHASQKRPAGFCIFNNIAVAAASLLARADVGRVAIFDWDVHHGNGTQDQFWNNPDVLFVSTHQWPHFPGSGLSEQIGGDDALGKIVNFPLPAGTGDDDLIHIVESFFTPLVRAFEPDHLLVSVGFDGHERDPLAGMAASSEGFGRQAARLKALADELCGGRLTLFLEGGYDLRALTDSAAAVVAGISGVLEPEILSRQLSPTSRGRAVIERTRAAIRPYWSDVI